MNEEVGENARQVAKLVVVVVIVAIALIGLASSLYTIPAGHRGVILSWGAVEDKIAPEGLGFKIPIKQRIKKVEVRIQKTEANADSASKDLQDVQTTIALNYHVNPGEVNRLYQEYGPDYRERKISPSIQESVKAVTARFTAEELITRRAEVKIAIRDLLVEKLSDSYIIVDDFNIVNFQFSASFDAAIEAKQVAEQDALRAKRELEKVKIEAEQKVVQAQAEADALRLQAEQIAKSKDILELRWIEKWNGQVSQVSVTSGGAVPFINIPMN